MPWFAYDGLFDAWPINTYASKLVQRQAVPTPVTLQVGAFLVSGTTYRLQMRACLEETAAPVTLRFYAVVVEDHFPASPTYSRNTFRAATATTDVTLQPGVCYYEARDLTFSATWVQANLGVIAWAQVPATGFPALVYQAGKDMWPFAALPIPGDMNCDLDVTFTDINPFVLAMTNPTAYEAVFPDCDIQNGDINGDGEFNFRDINPFVELLTGS